MRCSHFSQNLQVVELDPLVAELAKKYFGFSMDEQLKVGYHTPRIRESPSSPPYKYKSESWFRCPTHNRSKINIFLPLFALISSNPMLFIAWSDDQKWCPRLAGWHRATRATSLPRWGPSRVRASIVHLLVCLETSYSSSRKQDWLSFGGLLINLAIFHHISAISSMP